MKNKFNIIEKVTIGNVASEGRCVAKHNNEIIFVDKVAPGDICDLKITKRKKKVYFAVPTFFHHYSTIREAPFCSHYGICGGCKWQHIKYENQLLLKHQQVIDSFKKIGNITLNFIHPMISAEPQLYYRNKLDFTFSDNRWLTSKEIESGKIVDRDGLGFHIAGKFDKILDISHCYLQDHPSNKIRLLIKHFSIKNNIPFFNLINQTGFLRNLIIRISSLGKVMIILQVTQHDKKTISSILNLLKAYQEVTSLNYVINNKKNDSFSDLDVIHYDGDKFLEEKLLSPISGTQIIFRISPKSFYQTNSYQTSKLYKRVWELAKIKSDEIVYDLYTGIGTIGLYVSESAKKVVGIECIEEAVKDAEINAKINNITNTSFFSGDMKAILNKEFMKNHGHPDVIISDPPRSGMHPDVIKAILQSGTKRIIYISCNPATQARDFNLLSEKYFLDEIQPVDMFPHTHHVENIISLIKVN